MGSTAPMSHSSPAMPRAAQLRWLGAVLLLAGLPSVARAEAAPADGLKLFQTYCFECHADGVRKGKVDLEEMLTPANLKAQPREWERAWKIVRHEFMPPVGADRPTPAERKTITDWILSKVFDVDFAHPDPGRVTIRRLNRVEYENSVQDLFGHDFASEQSYASDNNGNNLTRLRDRLPPDDTAFGFDNIGDFQTISPALLERYFDIAESVVGQVVQFAPREPEVRISAADIKAEKSTTDLRTTQTAEFEARQAGEYRVDVQFTLGGWQEYGGGYDFAMRVGDQTLAKDFVEDGGSHRYRFTKTIILPAGRHTVTLTTSATKPDFKGKMRQIELRPRITVAGPLGVAEYSEPHRRIFTRGPAPTDTAARTAYAREILGRFALKAFRRPVAPETLDGLTALAMQDPTFERGVAQALSAIITSPKFLFRAETQPRPDDPKSVHPLDEFALASRLSYLLWLSLPDDELLTLAGEGKLRANLHQQVKRMLGDAKSQRFFEDFPGQWLRTRNVLMTAISRDADLAPVRSAMKRETEMLFEHVARNDLDLMELVTADYSFLNQPLAEFYGMKGLVTGTEFQKVTLPADAHRGVGILSHGSFLVSTSNPNRTSPVKRGLFVLENLLAVEPPPPPPDIPALDDAAVGGVTPKTVREQLAIHRENKSCAACHAHFDPIGIVLENYDLMGRWRTRESGQHIEAREKTVTGETLTGVTDLRDYFASRRAGFYRAATEKLLTYALGRGLEPFDSVTVDRIAADVAADGGKFSTLLLGVIDSPAFQTRRGDDGSAKDSPRQAIPPTPPPEKRKPPKRRRELPVQALERPADTANVTADPPPAAAAQQP